jgi:HlyD family secretion protein
MKKFFQNHKKLLIIAGILILVVMGYFIYQTSNKSQAATQFVVEKAGKQTLVVSVSGSGQMSAVNSIDLKPPSGSTQAANTVASVNVMQSQQVKSGQLIATLDQKNAILAVNQARANLESAQANYNKLLAGPTTLDLQSFQNSINSAQLSLSNAQRNLDNTKIQQATAVSNSLRAYLNSDTSAIPSQSNLSSLGTPSISGSYGGTDQGSYTITIYNTGDGLKFTVSGFDPANGGLINSISPQALGTKGLYIQFLSPNNVRAGDSWTVTIPNTQADNYLANYNAYQTALQTQSQTIANAQAQVDSAQAGLQQAQTSLAQKQQPAAQSDIVSSKALVDNAQTQLQTAQNNYNNNIITAPFDSQIAALNIQKGDAVNSATVLATLVTTQKLAQVSLNEVDAAKVTVGQAATLTFDALPDLTLTGKVVEVDIIGTVSQGVVSYNAKISLDVQNDQIKPGMSVSADIITNVKENVIAVPSSAVKTQNGQSYVQLLNSANPAPAAGEQTQVTSNVAPAAQAVTVGLSNDTMTEITSGLNEGDVIVIQTITSASTTSTSNSTSRTTGSNARIPAVGGGGFFLGR